MNGKSTKRNRAMLEAINAGDVPHFSAGGFASTSFANSYAPSLAINVAGSGDGRRDAQLASMIADHVDRSLECESACNFDPLDGRIGVQF